jgi:hypothetical protein
MLRVHIKGEVPYFKLNARNIHVVIALRCEAFVHGLGTEEQLGGLKYRGLCKQKIKDDATEKWKDDNQGKFPRTGSNATSTMMTKYSIILALQKVSILATRNSAIDQA